MQFDRRSVRTPLRTFRPPLPLINSGRLFMSHRRFASAGRIGSDRNRSLLIAAGRG